VGLILFIALLGVTWLTFGRVIRATRGRAELRWAHDLARMGQVSLIGYASAGAFLNLAFFDLYYLVVALAVIAADRVRAASPAGAARARREPAFGRRRGWGDDGRSLAVRPTDAGGWLGARPAADARRTGEATRGGRRPVVLR
jgi:hypothetical protein